MARCITDPAELLHTLDLPLSLLPQARAAAKQFSLRVPRGFVALMQRGDPQDPLLRQVLPLGDELDDAPGYVDDPLGESCASLGAGLLGKYHGRVLIIASPVCAVHCRYCFRRGFPYAENQITRSQWQATLERIGKTPDVSEVILSGGDPLSLDDGRLAAMIRDLENLPRLKRLRIHTRLPVVLPERLDSGLAEVLAGSRLKPVMVLHANHAREITDTLAHALAALAPRVTLLNQSVLLRGVNDDADTLAALNERLFDAGILPYYLHMPDRIRGSAHFEVSEGLAQALMAQLRERLPGYLVPRLVRELPGMPSKYPLA